MGTRSSIAIKTEDGIKAIYCHWDGYVDHNGRLLKEFYNTTDKVKELIALGDLSTLGSMIGQKHDFDSKYGPEPELDLTGNWCLAYGRDRGETGTEAQINYLTMSSSKFVYPRIECSIWSSKPSSLWAKVKS